MNKNELLKVLLSLPVILVVMYFMPFFGIVMLIARKILGINFKYPIGITFIILTGIIVIPKFLDFIIGLLHIDNITYLDDILSSDVYKVLLERGKLLFIIGVIGLIVGALTRKVKDSAVNSLRGYFNNMQERDNNVFHENDLLMQEKQERSKNTHFVHCPHCGANNVINGSTGKCTYCKSNLEYK